MEEVSAKNPSVGAIGLKYGLISGLVGIVMAVIQIFTGNNPYESKFDVYSAFGLIVSFVIVFLAHREFKNEGDGFMSFGQGLGIGMLLGVIGLALFLLFTYFYMTFIDPTLWDAILDKARTDMEKRGQNDEGIEAGLKFVKPIFWIAFLVIGTFMSFVYALLVTIFTQKKRPETF